MKPDDLNALQKILKNTSVTAIEISGTQGRSVRLERTPSASPKTTAKEEEKSAEPPQPAAPNRAQVLSNQVGIFYRGKNKSATFLVKAGQHLKKGTIVGVIESMGTLHNVATDVSGKVVEFLVENQHAVEWGQPVVVIEPDPAAKESK